MTATASRPAPPEPSIAVLERNLAALDRLSPGAAREIERARPSAGMEWVTADDGAESASLQGRWLASRRRPLEEAERLAGTVDIKERAGVVVLGFGLGRHVEAIARKIARTGLVVVFEPDVELLRAVFERVDCSRWIRETNVVLLTDGADAAGIGAALRGAESLVAMGTQIVAHAPSAPRLGDRAGQFGETFARVVSALRTSLVTTLVQTETTIRNLLMNIGAYASCPGVADLEHACVGRPAVVVSAGPSLARNVRLLAEPGVRDRCVIVAVQTALKPLLEAGVRPHFVTALDHHEISARFYEGLTPEMVEGVTLIAEPKANPRILDSFPGAVRCPSDDFLRSVLGEEFESGTARGSVPPGATVAHLAYYVTRLMGCDPVALIGQDLGFTDGQYYAAGAAIHSVWAGELNTFRTLEMFEWERIARSRGILREATDHLGRHVYSDEQMMTYLAQFERDFQDDESKGLLTVDATEGGVRKAHTQRMRLADFLRDYAPPDSPPLPALHAPTSAGVNPELAGALRRRLRDVRAGVWRVGDLTRRADGLLGQMLERHEDQARVNALIERVYALRDEATACQPAYALTQRFNQAGAFKRAKADRAIGLDADAGADEMVTQRARIERDRQNLRWLGDSADALGGLLDHAVRALDGAPKLTRDALEAEPTDGAETPAPSAVVAAMILIDPARILTPTSGPLAGRSLLRMTLERLARVEGLARAVLLTDDPTRTRELVGAAIQGLEIAIERVPDAGLGRRAHGVRVCRAWAPASWRGAIGNLTVYDELLSPDTMADAMERLGIDAALLVGPDWVCVDPALTAAVIERHRERPDKHRLAFTQAAPGLCAMVIDRHVMRDIAEASQPGRGGVFASIGGLLGYVPVRPKADPIAQPICVGVAPIVRDAGLRFIPDTSGGRAAVDAAISALGERFATASAEDIARAGAGAPRTLGPRHLVLEATARRSLGGRRAEWARAGEFAGDRTGELTPDAVRAAVADLARERNDVVVTFGGAGDPALHPDLPSLVRAARQAGAVAVHVRTDLAGDDAAVTALIAAGADVVSVDLLAQEPATYGALTGGGDLALALANLDRVLAGREPESESRWLRAPIVVPRMTRCDAVYEELEAFYDRATLVCGHAMLDPLPPGCAGADERIAGLPVPRIAAERGRSETRIVLCDGERKSPAPPEARA